MKQLIILFAIAFSPTVGTSQTVANEVMNIVYIGVDNPLSIAMFNYDCGDIILRADVGKLTKTECGKYIYSVTRTGTVNFEILSIKGGVEKKLHALKYRVKELPQPSTAYQNALLEFSVVSLRKVLDLGSIILSCGNTDSFNVIKFNYLLVRDTAFISSDTNDGGLFSEKLKDEILHLLPGDRIFFENIIVQYKDGEFKKLNPIILKLII